MNNRIDLADIYGLNRRDNGNNMYNKTKDINPPSLEQISDGSVSDSNSDRNPNGISDGELSLEGCASGRCRFSKIPHIHTSENECTQCGSTEGSGEIIEEFNQPYPLSSQNIQYLNTFIRSQVGRRVHVEFLVGGSIVEKDGYLMAVGANFILLNPIDSNDMIACDFYNIKFMRFYY